MGEHISLTQIEHPDSLQLPTWWIIIIIVILIVIFCTFLLCASKYQQQ